MKRRGSYGIDAPYVLIGLLAGGIVPFAAGFFFPHGWIVSLIGLINLISAVLFVHTTLRGKFVIWHRELAGLGLRGTEKIADLGCGRGAVLTLAAQMVPQGRVTGVDLWRSTDQSGNEPEATMKNVTAEGVEGLVTLDTADLRALPYVDGEFDVVLSSLAIHNIRTEEDRLAAVNEAARILKPGGRLMIADISHASVYAAELQTLGFTVVLRPLGWQFWYGGPWIAASMVHATKP
jgi:ubiquinone/menaquinone biosynthesis C-methylase UbiE